MHLGTCFPHCPHVVVVISADRYLQECIHLLLDPVDESPLNYQAERKRTSEVFFFFFNTTVI